MVHLKDSNKYLLFYQGKYALDKKTYATIGGYFEHGESAIDCAKRELLEEAKLESDEWIYLGKYRSKGNRGGGYVHSFLAKNSYLSQRNATSDDSEYQERKLLSKEELIKVILHGEVLLTPMLMTMCLSLLYEQYPQYHIPSNEFNKSIAYN